MPSKAPVTQQTLRDRIVELRRIPARELQAHSNNWREHPQAQRDLFAALARDIGIAGALLVYHSERQGGLTLIDGHLRQADYPDQEWPCLLTDLDDAEADELLMLYDPVAQLAVRNDTTYRRLAGNVQSGEAAIQQFLSEQAGFATGEIIIPEPSLQREPELLSECLVEVRCSRKTLTHIMPQLEDMQDQYADCTINISD